MASLTLKDIPADLHEQLRRRAARNRRSLSQEALACLELATSGEPVDPRELIARARRLRASVKPVKSAEVRAWIGRGRP
jgi:plasmid stability protein